MEQTDDAEPLRPRWAADARHAVASLFTLRPAPGPRWPIALQASLAIALPIAVLTLAGEPGLGYQAATGAFTALYASHLPVVERVRVLPFVGAALFAAAAVGVLAGPSEVATLIGLAVVTIVASTLAFGFSLGPPGPLFFVLVYGLSTHVSAAGADGGVFLAALAGGILLALLLTASPLVLRRVRRMRRRPLRDVLPGPSWPLDARLLLLRAVIAAVLGTLVGVFVDPDRAYWIVGAAIAVIGTAADRRAAFSRGLHRMVGTLAGAGLFLLLAPIGITGVWLALVLGILQFTIEIVVVRNYALALTFITPLVLLLTGAATGEAGSMAVAVERLVDTLAGAALGAATGLLHARRDDA
ncbi:FUSC family protein [Microbacterium sp. B2969]|uniref:FUSC family protein n=1 Tax=Microbacterium alkaliflavum TaxID=3248839 RepID=A0ABW7QCM4_9MICO